MANYEKFEDWMIGKKVKHMRIGFTGEVVRDQGDKVMVIWEKHGAMDATVDNLEFLEEAKEETIPWEVGQEVFCLLRGKGAVNSVQKNQGLWECVTVKFEVYGNIRYRLDGKVSQGMNRCLFFSEPQIIAETMPPKKPFVPVLKKGDVIVLQTKVEEFAPESYVLIVKHETEDEIYCLEDASYTKAIWTVHKLGSKVEFNI